MRIPWRERGFKKLLLHRSDGRVRAPIFVWQVLWSSARNWSRHRCARLGAAISFYTTFSLAPVLAVAIAIAAFLFGEPGARTQLIAEIGELIGSEAAKTAEAALISARLADNGLVATSAALVAILIGASGVMIQLRDALDQIFDAPESTESLWEIVKNRLLGLSLLLSVGFLLLVSLVVNAVVASLFGWISPSAQWLAAAVGTLDFTVSVALTTLFFALLMRWLPSRHPRLRPIVLASTLGALLFAAGKVAIGFYLGKAGVGSAYGAAGSIVVIMAWVYFSAQIFLFAAEVARALDALGAASAPIEQEAYV